MSAEHSPLPWSLGWDYQELQLKDADGMVLTEWTFIIPTYEPWYTEARAECDTGDAEFIVLCVNAHDELVAMVEELSISDGLCLGCMKHPEEYGHAKDCDVMLLLAKARGES